MPPDLLDIRSKARIAYCEEELDGKRYVVVFFGILSTVERVRLLSEWLATAELWVANEC